MNLTTTGKINFITASASTYAPGRVWKYVKLTVLDQDTEEVYPFVISGDLYATAYSLNLNDIVKIDFTLKSKTSGANTYPELKVNTIEKQRSNSNN